MISQEKLEQEIQGYTEGIVRARHWLAQGDALTEDDVHIMQDAIARNTRKIEKLKKELEKRLDI